MEAIKVLNLCKNYKDVKALDNVSLDVNDGELFGLLGVNGAGKTTLIKILCGLSKKSSGEAYIFCNNVATNMDEIKRIIDKLEPHTRLFIFE